MVSNWAVEAARFAPGLRTVVCLTESTAKRGRPIGEVVAGADLVVTSYALLRIEFDQLAELDWSGLILDEAQFVKNHRAKTYQCARRISAAVQAGHHRHPAGEQPDGPVGAAVHHRARPVPHRRPVRRVLPPADRTAPGCRPAGQQLRRRIRPFLLRRTKDAVAAELPPKQEQVVEVELHPRHQRLYQTHLQRERQKVLGLIEDLDRNRFTVLRSLTLLRRLSLDAALLDEANAGVPAAKVEVLLADLAEIVRRGPPGPGVQPVHQLPRPDPGPAGRGRDRVRLSRRPHPQPGPGRRSASATGEASVFLISLKAGGFGLNLSEAGYCFVLDPWWNPATEAQAVDRAHRIGQTKSVMVYRLVAKGTIEEKVMALKARKQELVRLDLRRRRAVRSGADRRRDPGFGGRLTSGTGRLRVSVF